jgi:hypothetical protein
MRRTIPCTLLLAACFSDPPPLPLAAEGTTGPDDPPATSSEAAVTSLGSASSPSSGGAEESSGSTAASSSGSDDDVVATADDESGDSGSTGGASSTGAPPYDGPYGDCWEGKVQQGEHLCPASPCVTSQPEHSACAPLCEGGCEAGPEGAAAVCLPTIATGTLPEVCVLPCSGDGATCPDAMECAPTTFEDAGGSVVWLCMWP